MSGDRSDSDSSVPDAVHLTIRCAFQTHEDCSVEAPIVWTVKQLKQHISQIFPTHPGASTLKLIYGGHCLQDGRTLKSIFEQVPPVTDGPTVFHLVAPILRTEPQLRERNNATNRSAASSSQLPNYQELLQNLGNYPPVSNPPTLNAGQDYLEYYRNYVNYCRTQQMATSQWQSTIPNAFPHPVYINNGFGAPAVPYFVNAGQNQPINLTGGNNPPIVLNPVAAQENAPQQVPAAVQNRGVGGLVDDGLELFYKGIRLLFILSAVILYSTFERFLLVIGIVLVILFTQYRRAENRRAAANIQPVNNNNAGEQQQNQQPANENDETNNDVVNLPPAEPIAVPPQATFHTALSAVYSFVTSFIASLIPDHVPIDVN